MRASALPLVLALGVTSCGTGEAEFSWERVACEPSDEALIDAAIDDAAAVEEYVEGALAFRYGDDVPTYHEILGTLLDVRERDRIWCAEDRSEPPASWTSHVPLHRELILVNTASVSWADMRSIWEDTDSIREWSEEEIRFLVSSDELAVEAVKDDVLLGMTPSLHIAVVLTHEATHLTERRCCHHNLESPGMTDGRCDFVEHVSYLVGRGVIWTRWYPYQAWLYELYGEVHAADG